MLKKKLRILYIIVFLFVGLYTGYQYYYDTNSFEKLTKARDYLDKGKEALLKNAVVDERDMEMSYMYVNRGIEMLYSLKNQKSMPICPKQIRKEAIIELINYYESYPNREKINDKLSVLLKELEEY